MIGRQPDSASAFMMAATIQGFDFFLARRARAIVSARDHDRSLGGGRMIGTILITPSFVATHDASVDAASHTEII
jgi:hypothetical protein